MKYVVAILTILMLSLTVFSGGNAQAADATISITVTIRNLALSINNTSWAFTTDAGGTVTSTPFTVTNDGNVNADFSIAVADGSGTPWASASAAGTDQFVLSHAPNGGSFVGNDIPTNPTLASGITPAADYLFQLEFKAPTAVSDFTPHTLTVTISSSGA